MLAFPSNKDKFGLSFVDINIFRGIIMYGKKYCCSFFFGFIFTMKAYLLHFCKLAELKWYSIRVYIQTHTYIYSIYIQYIILIILTAS